LLKLSSINPTFISLYPNPAYMEVTLSIPEQLRTQSLTLELLDLNGRILETKEKSNEDRVEWEVSTLAKGMYVIRMTTQEEVLTMRFVKQ